MLVRKYTLAQIHNCATISQYKVFLVKSLFFLGDTIPSARVMKRVMQIIVFFLTLSSFKVSKTLEGRRDIGKITAAGQYCSEISLYMNYI